MTPLLTEPTISPEETRQEWQSVKRVVITKRYPRDWMADLWSLIYQYHADQFRNLIKLAQLSLTCPVHTAGCERGFSKQNLILSSLLNRLLPETQDKLCRIAIEGPPRNEFPFVEALTVWRSEKKSSSAALLAPMMNMNLRPQQTSYLMIIRTIETDAVNRLRHK